MKLNRQHKGFTLIELLVVLIISGILISIALPNMMNLVAQQRVQNRIDQIWAMLQFSKAEAMRVNKPVIICPTTVISNLAQTSGCKSWKTNGKQSGLLAFSDNNMDQKYTATDDTLLRSVLLGQNGEDESNIKVTTTAEACSINATNNNCTELTDTKKLIFMPDGRFGWGDNVANGNGWSLGTANLRIIISDVNKPQQIWRQIVITPGGKAVVCPVSATANTPSYCKRNK